MTKEEKIIATAFTGIMFIDGSDMGSLYEYMEKKVGHGVFDLMLADKSFWKELHKACEKDFTDMVSKEQPSLPSNLDEAAEEYAYNNWEDNDYHTGASEGLPFNAIGHTEKCFKAGAEWMARQGVILNLSIDEFSCGAYNACVEQGLTSEDDVIVQIRKKEENYD